MVIAMTLSHLTILIFDSVFVAVWMNVDSNDQQPTAGGNVAQDYEKSPILVESAES